MLLLGACSAGSTDTGTEQSHGPLDDAVLNALDPTRIKEHVDFLASDDLAGRIPGSVGHEQARAYLEQQLAEVGLMPLGRPGRMGSDYVFPYPQGPREDRFQLEPDGSVVQNQVSMGFDLVGLLPGSDPELADEYIVLMAHYDHLGVDEQGNAYNGAFDNAAAVGLSLELARVLVDEDARPGRSVVFVLTDGEESGLGGSEAWLADSTVDAEDIVFGLSLDPLGRRLLPDYDPIVVIGLERSPTLLDRFRQTAQWVDCDVHFINRDIVPVFSSDQDMFYTLDDPIGAGWFTNPGFSFYHTTYDTPDTIDYRQMLENGRFVAQILADLGGDGERYPYEGASEVGTQAALDAKGLLEGALTSDELSGSERSQAEYYIENLDQVIEAGSSEVIDNAEALYFGATYFLLFQLGQAHPGEIPPPWPE